MSNELSGPPSRRYVWPWFVWGAFLLGCALAVVWMRAEIKRIREQRQPPPGDTRPPTPTNAPPRADARGSFLCADAIRPVIVPPTG